MQRRSFFLIAAALIVLTIIPACTRNLPPPVTIPNQQTAKQPAASGAEREVSTATVELPTTAARSHAAPAPLSGVSKAVLARLGWQRLDGRRATLGELQGQVVLLDFYATWCAPCRAATPQLVELERKYNRLGLRVIGLNVGGEEDLAEVPTYVREFAIPYQLGSPDDELVAALFGDETTIPQTFIFNRDGTLIKRFIGYDESYDRELEQLINQTVNDKSSVVD